MDSTIALALPRAPECSAARSACFHCGEPCLDGRFERDERVFCCLGCQAVHDLLSESGLGHFYELNTGPGVRIRETSAKEQWACLDDPALQRRLLDFTDGKTSRVTFHVPGIHCVACVWLLENLFRLHRGVGSSRVNFPRRDVAISFSPAEITLAGLAALLASIGYEPVLTLKELEKRTPSRAGQRQWLQLGIAGFAFGNIMLFSLPLYLGLDALTRPVFRSLFGGLSLALALPVLVYSASDYWRSAFRSLRRRTPTLDIPIALGLVALYGRSAFEILSGRGEGYLDSLAGLVFFLLCGRAFQQKTHERMAFDRDYKSFFPLSVRRKSKNGEESAAISQLKVGDRVILRNSELIPADAILLNGAAQIDYSFVTGEAEPVPRRAGDYLYAGGRQIGGAIEVETVKAVSQSYLASLWDHEAFRKNNDDGFTSLTDRYSRRFTLIVLCVALGAMAYWTCAGDAARAIKAFISVLIVACPCALALAAPFTLGTAQRCLARRGVFLKNSAIVERIARVNTIVFDKTGTLTQSTAAGVRFIGKPLCEAERRWVSALTHASTHPISGRIHDSLGAERDSATIASFKETPGCGVEALVDGHPLLLGSKAWLERRGANAGQACCLPANTANSACLAIDGAVRGAFETGNALRANTEPLLQQVSCECEVALLSGDNPNERERFRTLFGDESALRFNQSPLDKLEFIRSRQQAGRIVMMVGDGLNDAGALRQSDVGVAVTEKAGSFSPASDVILEACQVPQLGEMIAYSRSAVRIVRLGFGISALYNAIGVSIAAAGVLSPIICAVLMPLSSVSVVLFACGMTTWRGRSL